MPLPTMITTGESGAACAATSVFSSLDICTVGDRVVVLQQADMVVAQHCMGCCVPV